ncbi:MAG: iron ABC transporter permease [Chloroflexi bacterium]|nr:iron ABC transporter permease [Anaerolineaceae bacterium]NLI44957.1 iron ABC transporter permease [Chloroflexota bacterium]HOE35272.1 iron ABC transporter permease [Anaerolineaceae bacterium]HOT26108.1 iron ABC transporter permease [Anaerolineaceae bacterium]HQK03999.1 iron ABC transporter permease [Anaerolineaceae bacterium]
MNEDESLLRTDRGKAWKDWLWVLFAVSFVLLLGLSVFLGRYPQAGFLRPGQLRENELARLLVLNIRLPRLLTAALLGMVLAASGTVFQMIFANPLVEPGFLGVSQGAAFGAAVAIVFLSASAAAVQGTAALFAFLGLGFSYLLARRIRVGSWLLRLVLAGIAVSALFSAGLGIVKYLADPLRQLPEITFWMLGGLASITWDKFWAVLPACLLGLALIFAFRWRLNLLALDETTSFSLGAAPRRERSLMMVAAVLATSAIISVAGMVGWIGLIIPHIARRLVGSDTRRNLPAAMLLGGAFAVICDDLARMLIAGEIPLGILTSLLGAAIFMVLMARGLGKGVRV